MTEKRNREELIAKRNLLFRQFLKNPRETHLVIEIKVLDDRIAEITQRIADRERNTGTNEKKSA